MKILKELRIVRPGKHSTAARARPGVRWQAGRDTAFKGKVLWKVRRRPNAASRPPHSTTLR
ncbi:MAG: hypothetical protein ACRED1_12660, partial [Limisphaerales bacterium]